MTLRQMKLSKSMDALPTLLDRMHWNLHDLAVLLLRLKTLCTWTLTAQMIFISIQTMSNWSRSQAFLLDQVLLLLVRVRNSTELLKSLRTSCGPLVERRNLKTTLRDGPEAVDHGSI